MRMSPFPYAGAHLSRDSMLDSPVPSPCINVCVIDECTGFCAGCFRTLDEIAGWGDLSETDKRAILIRVDARRAAGEAGNGALLPGTPQR